MTTARELKAGDKLWHCGHKQDHLVDLRVGDVHLGNLFFPPKAADADWWLCCDACFQSSEIRKVLKPA